MPDNGRYQRVVSLDLPEDPPPVDTRLVQLANQVRSLYCVCFREVTGDVNYGTRPIPQWDGDPTGETGRRTKPVWPKIAEVILRCGADPFVYIRAQFYTGKRDKPPAPNTFYNEQAIANYEGYRAQARRDLFHKIESDINQIRIHVLPFTVNLGWDPLRALEYALRDQTCGASMLVRYCVAVKAQLPVAAEFRGRALIQYMFQMSEYDELLQGKLELPIELKEEATSLRRSILGQ